jgi:hypothetical protein
VFCGPKTVDVSWSEAEGNVEGPQNTLFSEVWVIKCFIIIRQVSKKQKIFIIHYNVPFCPMLLYRLLLSTLTVSKEFLYGLLCRFLGQLWIFYFEQHLSISFSVGFAHICINIFIYLLGLLLEIDLTDYSMKASVLGKFSLRADCPVVRTRRRLTCPNSLAFIPAGIILGKVYWSSDAKLIHEKIRLLRWSSSKGCEFTCNSRDFFVDPGEQIVITPSRALSGKQFHFATLTWYTPDQWNTLKIELWHLVYNNINWHIASGIKYIENTQFYELCFMSWL